MAIFSEMTEDEREDAEREKDEMLDWAEGQGWRRNARVRDVNLL